MPTLYDHPVPNAEARRATYAPARRSGAALSLKFGALFCLREFLIHPSSKIVVGIPFAMFWREEGCLHLCDGKFREVSIMPKRCVVYGCKNGYDSTLKESRANGTKGPSLFLPKKVSFSVDFLLHGWEGK